MPSQIVAMRRGINHHIEHSSKDKPQVREHSMQCLMQVFDSDGNAQLRGGSKLKEHIDWVLLLAWNPHWAQRPPNSAGGDNSVWTTVA